MKIHNRDWRICRVHKNIVVVSIGNMWSGGVGRNAGPLRQQQLLPLVLLLVIFIIITARLIRINNSKYSGSSPKSLLAASRPGSGRPSQSLGLCVWKELILSYHN